MVVGCCRPCCFCGYLALASALLPELLLCLHLCCVRRCGSGCSSGCRYCLTFLRHVVCATAEPISASTRSRLLSVAAAVTFAITAASSPAAASAAALSGMPSSGCPVAPPALLPLPAPSGVEVKHIVATYVHLTKRRPMGSPRWPNVSRHAANRCSGKSLLLLSPQSLLLLLPLHLLLLLVLLLPLRMTFVGGHR